jgi:TRAP-type mannitol/chloroaromatic compound transport system permease small subunit
VHHGFNTRVRNNRAESQGGRSGRERAELTGLLTAFITRVDAVNYRIGRFAMHLLFALMAVLIWSSLTKTFANPSLWTLEMAQFIMVAYYVLGGPYAMQMGSHVRMDLFYARQSARQKAWWDAFTVLAVIFYLAILLWGAVESGVYSLAYNERSPTAWRPYLWPVKLIMIAGFALMLLQALSALARDILTLKGVTLTTAADRAEEEGRVRA